MRKSCATFTGRGIHVLGEGSVRQSLEGSSIWDRFVCEHAGSALV